MDESAVDDSLLNLKRSLQECNHELMVPDAQPSEVKVWNVPQSSGDSCTRCLGKAVVSFLEAFPQV